MNYCVIKNTVKVIDGSNNSKEIMLKNAESAGFIEKEIEILTEDEYKTRLENEPKPPQPPTTEERLQMAEDTILFLMDINLMGGM